MRKIYTKPAITRAGLLSSLAGGLKVATDVRRSDRRLKTNIARIGTTVFGLPLYRFAYRGSEAVFTGVMAQDVLGVMPQAVSRDAAGFYRVDYGMIGVEMQRVA